MNNHAMDNININQFDEESIQTRFKSIQSANTLFKLMGKIDYLEMCLKNKAILPRYYEEHVDYLNISNLKSIAFPMSCFCDIHLERLKHHIKNYGGYGLGLTKDWGELNGLQPILYLNPLSGISNDIKYIFDGALKQSEKRDSQFNDYNNFLLSVLKYTKPVQGLMTKFDGETGKPYQEDVLFHDEREWRFVPYFDSDTELPEVLVNEDNNNRARLKCSEGINYYEKAWLSFEYNDIRYLIVEDELDRRQLIQFIDKLAIEDEVEKGVLISKIIVYEEMKGDL